MIRCVHEKTKIWEPHLAGARKCIDCGMVYNPNHTPPWFIEPPSAEEKLAIAVEALDAADRIFDLSRNIAVDWHDNYEAKLVKETLAKFKSEVK